MPTLRETITIIGATSEDVATRSGLPRSTVALILNGGEHGRRYSRRTRAKVVGTVNAMRREAGYPAHCYTAGSATVHPSRRRPESEELLEGLLEAATRLCLSRRRPPQVTQSTQGQ